jgi:type III secretion protein Q
MNARAELRDDAIDPVGSKLPSLTRDDAERLRRLASGRRRFALAGGAWLELSGRRADATPWVVLGAGDDRLAVALDDERGDDGGESHWSDFDGESRLVAWSLAHERTLGWIGDVLGVRVLPLEFAGGGSDGVAIGVRVGDDVGAICTGALRVSTETLDRLMSDERAERLPDAGAAASPLNVPARIAATLAGPTLTATEIATLRSGDVIVAGSKLRALDDIRIDDGVRAWRARWDGPSLHVIEARPKVGAPQWRDSMSAVSKDNDTGESARGVADIPVRIEFAMGEIEVPFGELERIEAGYVFELGRAVDSASVEIRANGRRIARGQLVSVGDTLGVRITEADA